LINAARLAPLEELLAEVRSGAPASGTSAASSAQPPQRPLPFHFCRTANHSHLLLGSIDARVQPSSPRRGARNSMTTLLPLSIFGHSSHLILDSLKSVPTCSHARQPRLAVPQESPRAAEPEVATLAAQVSGITDAQVTEIKQAIQAQQNSWRTDRTRHSLGTRRR